ncbi:uncharacterized protein SCHCODRAFT_01185063 [Schizophyllum commune H4-8]|nr:uncharacterized protein SCHCODRAFT_01185063 [Schizophyllum commune H4-8]KAI5893868.1 hypothetical protein SCHCODRAFT_01185063 [Schizophyllum commune H4-8]
MTPPALPIELIEAIMDELSEPELNASLRSFALVHSVFLEKCQRRLFSSVTIVVPSSLPLKGGRQTPSQRLLNVLRGSRHLAGYIISLQIMESGLLSPAVIRTRTHGIIHETTLLQILPLIQGTVQSLKLSAKARTHVGDDFLNALCFPHVETLVLWDISVPIYILDGFPRLRALACHVMRWIPMIRAGRPLLIETQRMEDLEIGTQDPRQLHLFVGLASSYPPAFNHITTLRLSSVLGLYADLILVIELCKDRLERLEIACPDRILASLLDLGVLPRLQHLSFVGMEIANINTARSPFFSIMQKVQLLARLSLIFSVPSFEIFRQDTPEWKNLDEILGREDIRIGHISIYLNYATVPRGEVAGGLVASVLPRLHERFASRMNVMRNILSHSYLF